MTSIIKSIAKNFIIISLILLLAGGSILAATPRELFTRASNQYWSENYSRAEELYREFVEKYPENELFSDACFGLAQSLYKQEKYDEAGVWFGRVRRNHPDPQIRGDAFFGEIEVALLNDERMRARKLLQTFLNLYPDHALSDAARERLDMLGGGKETSSQEEMTEQEKEKMTPDTAAPPEDEFMLPDDFEIDFPDDLPPLRLSPDTPATAAAENKTPDTSVTQLTSGTEERRRVALVSELQKRVEELEKEKRRILKELQRQEEENRRFIRTATEYREQLEEQKKLTEKYKNKSERLEQELSRKIRGLLSDTRLYALSDDIDLSDTAVEALEEGVDHFRQRVEEAMQMGEYQVAWNNIQKVLRRSPRAEDYYKAAVIEKRLNGDTENIISNLRTAIDKADPIPPRYLIFRAELLLETDKINEFEKFFSNWAEEITSRANKEEKSRWHLLVGRRLLKQNDTDQAFFRLMEAVKTAPGSRWARQARQIIEDKM